MTKKSTLFRPTHVEINMRALRCNMRALRCHTASHVALLPVIKADAYGHGVQVVARELIHCGISFFGVASLDEALALREHGIGKDILLFEHTLPCYADTIVAYNLIQTVGDLSLARALNNAARKKRTKVRVHLKIDTGMRRLGVAYDDANSFIKKVSRLDNIIIDGIYTHFPCADTNKAFTAKQIEKFSALVRRARADGIAIRYIHAANSMGLTGGYDCTPFNLARPGLMLYGLYPKAALASRIALDPVMRAVSKIVFLKKVRKGEGISYNHTFVARRTMTVATVPVGYNDGYPRILSNKAFMLVGGVRCPVVGRITMDQLMIDVSRVSHPRIGMDVVLLGKQKKAGISADELAWKAGTINYEIVCSLGNRLPRIYKNTAR